MDKHKLRRYNGIKEIDKCILCNNKAQTKCIKCGIKVCNDCLINGKCYKCDANEKVIIINANGVY